LNNDAGVAEASFRGGGRDVHRRRRCRAAAERLDGMTDESEIATLSRRASLLEQDAEVERTVSRQMLRNLGDVENVILDLTKAVAELTKAVAELTKSVAETQRGQSRLEDSVMVSQAKMPRKFAEIAALVMREELAKRK
jgi:hypothetical protein